MSYVKLAQTLRLPISVLNASGQIVNADSTPTVLVYDNGVLMAYAPTVTNKTTGRYEAAVVCSAGNGFTVGHDYTVFAQATVSSIVGEQGLAAFELTTSGPDDLALAATALSSANWTSARAALIDHLTGDVALAATALSSATWTSARAALLDHLTADVATAPALATAQTAIAAIKAKTDNLPSAPADETLIINATNALANLIAAIPTTPALASALTTAQADLTTLIGRLTAQRASNLDATISSRADATALTAAASDVTAIKTKTDGLSATPAADVVAALNASEHRNGRTFLGLRRRLDGEVSGQLAGMNGPTGTLYGPAGEVEATGAVDPTAGTRAACDVSGSEAP